MPGRTPDNEETAPPDAAGLPFSRRCFISGVAGSFLLPDFAASAASTFPVHFRKPAPHETLYQYIQPGTDEFPVEKLAAEIGSQLDRLIGQRALPLAVGFEGVSPLPAAYEKISEDTFRAKFDSANRDFAGGLRGWLDSLGQVRSARYFVLAGQQVRYEIASTRNGLLEHRVGLWKQVWKDGRLLSFEPVEENLVRSARPLFTDITGSMFANTPSFQRQLLSGVPSWRARLDSASGIDLYGNNGIAVGDIDGDGWDEIYVCQPGGLPNRLYKNQRGTMQDLTENWGVDVLDDTTCALFLDLRNIGRQDLIVLTTSGPLLFLNTGRTFQFAPDAFHFAGRVQGTFTGMAAADYDRDGRLDLYLCTYVYYQSEDQFRYPVPYHDAQNGPPNFLFRNRLNADGSGYLEDVTTQVGLDENNHRYSFAPAWCDFDGDGWPDLYVANDFGRNNFYRNREGKFRDEAVAAGVEDIGPGMSATWLDYDGDGRPDLYVSNMWTASGQRLIATPEFSPARGAAHEAFRRHTKGNSLYRNLGDGSFEETGNAEGVEVGRWAWCSDALDFDNDGTPEIYVTCGMLTNSSERDLMSFFWRQVVSRSPSVATPAPDYEKGWNAINQLIREDYSWNGREPNVLYARRGGRFFDFSGVSGIDFADDSRAFAATDLDGDGNLDILLKSRLGPQVRALRNDWGVGRQVIALHLTGTRSNRDAIGARVELQHAGGRNVQWVRAGSGYLSQHTKTLHFGLGSSASSGKISITWPSGAKQDFENLAAGFRYEMVEGSDELWKQPFAKRENKKPTSLPSPDNRPELQATWLLEPVPLPERREGPGFVCLVAGSGTPAPDGVPFELVDLTAANPDVAAGYALFRRYLFDYRAGLTLPLLLLIDERGLAHKIYATVPETAVLRRDLELMREPDRTSLALPFPGRYYVRPQRNYYRLGGAFFWAGYPDQALLYLSEAVRREPENAKAHLAIGHIHLEAGRYVPARESLDRAAALLPDSVDIWNDLGSLELATKNPRAALGDFQKALAISADGVFALQGAGQAYAELGDAERAESTLRRALEINPRYADAANQLGLLLAGKDRIDEAREFFLKAVEADRRHAQAINNLGVLYTQTGKFDDAIAAFRYGIEVAPQDETLYLNLARAYVRRGDRTRAAEVLRQLLAQNPRSTIARRALTELGER